MSATRRTFTAVQKADVVTRHLRGKEPFGQLAEELNIQPSQIHQWVNTRRAQAKQAFARTVRKGKQRAEQEDAREQRIKKLAGDSAFCTSLWPSSGVSPKSQQDKHERVHPQATHSLVLRPNVTAAGREYVPDALYHVIGSD